MKQLWSCWSQGDVEQMPSIHHPQALSIHSTPLGAVVNVFRSYSYPNFLLIPISLIIILFSTELPGKGAELDVTKYELVC
jgi:hypothetical protein